MQNLPSDQIPLLTIPVLILLLLLRIQTCVRDRNLALSKLHILEKFKPFREIHILSGRVEEKD